MEDRARETDQPNLPGTADQYPNWRRKLARALDAFGGAGLTPPAPAGGGPRRCLRPDATDLGARHPVATYRLQLTAVSPSMRAALVPYLAELGVSHVYAPRSCRRARTHGYDIVDHNQLNPELGGRAAASMRSAPGFASTTWA